ncbi:ThiF family adenylyltransferase [bacterium]|jgi:molybdopterin/thiamine biosynthesis adenylyltransferase|nr:ThiF family adenylyltransferase [bacterium]
MSYSYQEFTSRNWLFINEGLQNKISKTKLFFAGCGLGSVIAETAVRVGFSNFLLVDGDNVEFSNLNRQIFTTEDIGKNKADATSTILKKINPLAEIKTVNSFIEPSNIKNLIGENDYVINTVDVNETFFELNKISVGHNKIVLTPLNIGFGSFLMIFSKDSEKIEEMFDSKNIKSDLDFFYALVEKIGKSKLPRYISSNLQPLLEGIEDKNVSPQLSIGANIVASLVVTNIIKIISGQEVPMSPDPILVDFFENNICR